MTDGEKEKKPGGRPRKYAGKRPTWTIRLEERYGEQIKAMAQEQGRSISEICEQQIVASFKSKELITQYMDMLADRDEDVDGYKVLCDIAHNQLQECRSDLRVAVLAKEEAEKRLAETATTWDLSPIELEIIRAVRRAVAAQLAAREKDKSDEG